MASNGSKSLIDDMFTEEARLNTFKNWPFGNTFKCNAPKMAEAGFFHCPTKKEPDLVQCYVCFKELDGWEANDEPWAEHFSHSKICAFAKKQKSQKDLTIAEFFEIEAERKINKVKRLTGQRIEQLRSKFDKVEDFASEVYEEIIKAKANAQKSNKRK